MIIGYWNVHWNGHIAHSCYCPKAICHNQMGWANLTQNKTSSYYTNSYRCVLRNSCFFTNSSCWFFPSHNRGKKNVVIRGVSYLKGLIFWSPFDRFRIYIYFVFVSGALPSQAPIGSKQVWWEKKHVTLICMSLYKERYLQDGWHWLGLIPSLGLGAVVQ